MPTQKLVVSYPLIDAPVDGIRDHGLCLAEHLNTMDGVEARLADAIGPRTRGMLSDADALIVEYQPFAYGRWGFAPWLPARLLALRARRRRPRIVLITHELYVPMKGWRLTLMGAWQRAQLAALRSAADVVCVSIEAWTERLRRARPRRRTEHLPVGSNLPDRSASRKRERDRLGADDDALVIAAFGNTHESRLLDYVPTAVNAVASEHEPVIFLNLGADSPRLEGIDSAVEVIEPGRTSAEAVAGALAASDLFLGAWADGASTRRTSLMAALQHGLPVVSTQGISTDPLLCAADDALSLVPVGRSDLFAEVACRIALDRDVRRRMGAAARDLYRLRFDWPVTARRLLELLDSA